jgi:hypothetical protein
LLEEAANKKSKDAYAERGFATRKPASDIADKFLFEDIGLKGKAAVIQREE